MEDRTITVSQTNNIDNNKNNSENSVAGRISLNLQML